MAALLLLLPIGCRQCELVEAELRTQTERVDNLQNLLAARESHIAALESALGERDAPPSGAALAPAAPLVASPVRRLTLGMLTGGRDLDANGVDDGIGIVLQPRDAEGDIVKSLGRAAAVLSENHPDGPRVIARWDIEPEILRQAWRRGLFGEGYQVILAWNRPPTNDKLQLLAVFTTPMGQTFQAEREVDVSLRGRPPAALDLPRTIDAPAIESAFAGLPSLVPRRR